MIITYTDTLAGVTESQLAGFFGSWSQAPTPAMHLRLLAGSPAKLLAIEAQTGQVVGYLGVALDAGGGAYVPMLEVLPAYQGLGVAGELTRRMMAKLAPSLVCAPEVSALPYRAPRVAYRVRA